MNDPKRNFLRSKTAAIIFYIAFIVFFFFVLNKNRDALSSISTSNLKYFIFVLVLNFLSVCVLGLVNVVTFQFGSQKMTFLDGYKLATINTIGNYLPFSGGLIAKGVFLKRDFGITYTHYAGISIYTFIVAFAVSGLTGLFSTLVVKPDSVVLIASFCAMSLVVFFVFLPLPEIPFLSNKVSTDRLQESRRFFRSVLLKTLIVFIALFLVAAGRIAYCFLVIGHDVPLVNALLLVSGIILTRLVTFVPGAVGIREALVGTLAYLTGVDYQMAIIAVGVDRLGEILVLFGIGGIIFPFLRRDPNKVER